MSAATYEPKSLLTREQAATMLTRVFKKYYYSNWTLDRDSEFPLVFEMPSPFADDDSISGWAYESVYFMAANGIINGMENNKFAPKNTTSNEEAVYYANSTREQALAIAVRLVDYSLGR